MTPSIKMCIRDRCGLDAHEHDPVTQPFGDAHAAAGADLAQERPERREHLHRVLVALALGQGGEARNVDEGKAAMHPHRWTLPRFRGRA